MSSRGPILETIFKSYKFAGANFGDALPYALVFALMTALTATLAASHLEPITWMSSMLFMSVAAFAAGCVLSAKLYGLVLRTGPSFPTRDDVINLGFANGAVYLFFALMAFFVAFFLITLPGVFVAQSGLLDAETVESDPDAVRRAFETVMAGPAGVIVAIVALGGAALLGFFGLRLVLFAIATFARGEIRVLSTWAWTTGSLKEIASIAVATHILPFLLCLFVFGTLVAHTAQFGPIGHGVTWFLTVLSALPFLMAGHAMAAHVYLQVAPNLVDAPRRSASL